MRKLLGSVAALAALLLSGSTLAAAQPAPEPRPVLIAGCFGVDHPPFQIDDPPPGASVLIYAGSLEGVLPESTMTITVDGPTGSLQGGGTVDSTARVDVLIGITSFGRYTVTDARVLAPGDRAATVSELVGRSFDVTAADVACTKAQLPPGRPQSLTTTTSAPATSTTSAPTTTEADDPRDAGTDDDDDESDDGSDFPWAVVIGLGVVLAAAGGALIAKGGAANPCDELLRRWEAAQRECDKAQAAAADAQQEVEDAEQKRSDLEDQRTEICDAFPPACAPESSIEDVQTGQRVTNTDLWIGKQWAQQAWDAYTGAPGPGQAAATEQAWNDGPSDEFRADRQGALDAAKGRLAGIDADLAAAETAEQTAKAAVDAARQKAADACAAADAARRAYEECIKAAPAPAAGGDGASTGGTDGGSQPGGGGPTGTTPPPEEGGPCTTGERRVEVLDRFDQDVVADFSLRVLSMSYRRAEESEIMSEQLGDLANQLDNIGDALGAASAAAAAGRGAYGEAVVGGTGTALDIPTSVVDLAGEILEHTADLGSKVAGAAGRWNARNDLYRVMGTIFVRRVQMEWQRVWRCENGVWKCEQVLVGSMGPLRRQRQIDEHDLVLDDARTRLSGFTRRLEGQVRTGMEAVQEFARRRTAGPCS